MNVFVRLGLNRRTEGEVGSDSSGRQRPLLFQMFVSSRLTCLNLSEHVRVRQTAYLGRIRHAVSEVEEDVVIVKVFHVRGKHEPTNSFEFVGLNSLFVRWYFFL